MNKPAARDEVSIDAHPPERKRRSTVLMAHGCCCCCCLHSVGGVAGAIWASLRRDAPLPETLTTEASIRHENELRTAHRLVLKVYWLALTLVGAISLAVLTLANAGAPVLGALLVAIFLPAGQLVASLVTLLYVQVRPPLRKAEALRRLGKITLFAFLGGLLGSIGVIVTFFTFGM